MTATVFFDLDGTLTNPEVGIVESIRYALAKLQVDAPHDDDLTWCIGPPLIENFAKLAGPERAEQAVAFYRERFSVVGWKENEVYPDVVRVLGILKARGHQMYVATSKPHVFADKIVDHFGLRPFFGQVFGSELDGTRSDKAELLTYAMSVVGCGSNSTMIGDRKHDVVGAKMNGLASIGVTYGFGGEKELEQAGADLIITNPGELLTLKALDLSTQQ